MSDARFFHIAPKGRLSSLATLDEAMAARRKGGYVWLDFGTADEDALTPLMEPFGLHPLAIEDCLDDEQVPKIEDFAGNTFVLFNRYSYRDQALTVEEVDFFLGKDFLITVNAYAKEQGERDRLDAALRIEQDRFGRGPDYLLHVILDHIVDDKLRAVESLQEGIDTLEEEMLRTPSDFNPGEIIRLRRDLLTLRKSLFHEREILIRICRMDSPFISEKSVYHFRDVYDHLVKFFEVVEMSRDMISSLTELYMSLVNNELGRLANRTNRVVRRLTFITTIFMPLTLLAGIGGMSEWSMMTGPENWRVAYPAFLLLMVAIGAGSALVLKGIERHREREP